MKSPKPDITDEERELFRTQTKDTRPIHSDKLSLSEQKPKPRIRAKSAKQTVELQRKDIESPVANLTAEDKMFFMRAGLQTKIIRKLQSRGFPIEKELDLHGMNIDQAQLALDKFMAKCIENSFRCVKLIHGKGSGSKDSLPILKNKINDWLRQYSNVLAFCSAKPQDGGTGAIYILLKIL